MNRSDYDRYLAAFNSKDYDSVFTFYKKPINMDFFGISIKSYDDLIKFYRFLHAHVIETITVRNFASSDTLTALDATVRIECIKDLDKAELDARGMDQFHPMKVGDVVEMRQFILYTIDNGEIAKVECAMAA